MIFRLFREVAIRAALVLALVACCGTAFAQQGKDIWESTKNNSDVDLTKDTWVYMDPATDSNVLWKTRVWRTIDCREAKNAQLMKVMRGDTMRTFSKVLLDLIKSGSIKARDPAFDSLPYFPLMLPYDIVLARLHVSGDSIPTCAAIKIVEDWRFLRREGQMVVTILRLTPVFRLPDASGNIVDSPLFWVSYEECRKYFGGYTVVTSGKRHEITLEEFFENRQFNSRITKVSNQFATPQEGVEVIEEVQGRFDYEAPERKHRKRRR
jgi:hypothetical protein